MSRRKNQWKDTRKYVQALTLPKAPSEALPVLLGQSFAKCVTPPQILQQPPCKKDIKNLNF